MTFHLRNSINRIVLRLLSQSVIPNTWRIKILRICGVKIGRNCLLRYGDYFTSRHVQLGDNVFINYDCLLMAGWNKSIIRIGDNVQIGPRCTFVCDTHEIGSSIQRAGKHVHGDIKIEAGSWIGANVTILPGVTVGTGCVIGAGSLVNKDIEQNCLYVGVPVHQVRRL